MALAPALATSAAICRLPAGASSSIIALPRTPPYVRSIRARVPHALVRHSRCAKVKAVTQADSRMASDRLPPLPFQAVPSRQGGLQGLAIDPANLQPVGRTF